MPRSCSAGPSPPFLLDRLFPPPLPSTPSFGICAPELLFPFNALFDELLLLLPLRCAFCLRLLLLTALPFFCLKSSLPVPSAEAVDADFRSAASFVAALLPASSILVAGSLAAGHLGDSGGEFAMVGLGMEEVLAAGVDLAVSSRGG